MAAAVSVRPLPFSDCSVGFDVRIVITADAAAARIQTGRENAQRPPVRSLKLVVSAIAANRCSGESQILARYQYTLIALRLGIDRQLPTDTVNHLLDGASVTVRFSAIPPFE